MNAEKPHMINTFTWTVERLAFVPVAFWHAWYRMEPRTPMHLANNEMLSIGYINQFSSARVSR